MISPPSECPIKLTRPRHDMGQNYEIYCLTSLASLSPMSKMSPSVRSSFTLEDRKIASGWHKERLFFRMRMSQELPWKPWHSTKRWTPLSNKLEGFSYLTWSWGLILLWLEREEPPLKGHQGSLSPVIQTLGHCPSHSTLRILLDELQSTRTH
jgi:hypothetical protein